MSGLSFNLQGERFEPPAQIAFWRVRRLKPGGRGVPDVVFGNDGLPLLLPVEADVAELRRLVRSAPGRYRLDAVDVDQQALEGPAAYVQIEEPLEAGPAAEVVTEDRELLKAVINANTEIARLMAEKFASVMESAATLLRAADGAGMPQRDPIPIEAEVIVPAPREPTEDSQLAHVLESTLAKAMPLLGHTINTKLLGLSTDQSLALLSGSPPPAVHEPDDEPEVATDPIAHISAVEKLLEESEVAMVRTAMTQMSPETLKGWTNRLMRQTPEQAVATIRGEIARGNVG